MRLSRLHATARQRGFTLVELLMVMLIISILAGLLLSGISIALARAKEARFVIQLDQLTLAINEYKNTYGETPPSMGEGAWNFATIDGDRRNMTLHIRKAFPQAIELGDLMQGTSSTTFQNIANGPIVTCPHVGASGNISPNFNSMDAAEAFVFFLGGPPVKVTGSGGVSFSTQGFSASPRNPLAPGSYAGDDLTTNVIKQRKPKLYEFPPGSLQDKDNDNWPEFYPENQPNPVVYFAAPYMTGTTTQNILSFPKDAGRQGTMGIAIPYMINCTTTDATTIATSRAIADNWVNPTGFQFIMSGSDNLFGVNETTTPRIFKVLNPALTAQGRDVDNLTNFARGRIGDAN